MIKWKLFFALCWQIILWLPPPTLLTDLVIPDRSINPDDRVQMHIRKLTAAVIGPGIGSFNINGPGGIART